MLPYKEYTTSIFVGGVMRLPLYSNIPGLGLSQYQGAIRKYADTVRRQLHIPDPRVTGHMMELVHRRPMEMSEFCTFYEGP